jgi:predicted dehydrogenase
VGLCDVDSHVLERGVKHFRDEGETVKAYTDLRQAIDDPDVDALSIATPNHWHALATIWAVQGGKDVYVEKPVCHEVNEGYKMVEAARKYKRIVQAGTQSRSSRQGIARMVDWVKAGHLGKIRIARGLCYKRRTSIGKVDRPTPVPDWIDYNIWSGPAPLSPLMRKRLHYDWHWVWPTGNGDIGNQGIHQMDIARWFLGEEDIAQRVMAMGGRFGYVDDATTPNTLVVWQDYPTAPLIFEVRGLPEKAGSNRMGKFMGAGIGVIVHCEGGHVLVPNYESAIAFDKDGKEIVRFAGAENHFANFLKAVRSRKVSDLNADIREGFISSALCLTGNTSYRVGALAFPEHVREMAQDQPDGENTLDRMLEHLKANDVSQEITPITLGLPLTMDRHRRHFVGNDRATGLMTRNYRAPFVVPERV